MTNIKLMGDLGRYFRTRKIGGMFYLRLVLQIGETCFQRRLLRRRGADGI